MLPWAGRGLHLVRLFVIVTSVVLAALPVGAQSPVGERTRFFGDVDVSVFNVDVFVTDREGQPVPGLGVNDFELLVDGEPVPILNFYEGRGGRRLLSQQPLAAATEAPPPDLPSDQRLHVVVYIDNTSIRPASRNRVIGKLREILAAKLSVDDRVLIVTQGPGLEIRHGFHDPLDELDAKLDEVADEVASTAQFESERLAIISELKRAPTLGESPRGGFSLAPFQQDEVVNTARSILDRIRSFQQWRFDTARQAAADLTDFMDALAGISGRKAMLYVGEGTPFRVAETLYQAWDDKFQYTWLNMEDPPPDLATLVAPVEANRSNLRRVFEAVAARAAASRITLYAIDAGQELATTQASAEHPGFSGASLLETSRLLHQQQSLQMLAFESGGRHFTNLENVQLVMERLAEDFSNYYSLGFAPEGLPDGESYSLEVKVRRPGLEVRHRTGFHNKSLSDLMADRLYSALLLEEAPNPLRVSAAPIETDRLKRGRFRVRLLARVPMQGLLLVSQAGEHLGRISAWVAVANEFGSTSEVHGRRIPVRIPTDQLETALQQDVGYVLDVVVRGGRQRVAVLVRDEISLMTSTVTVELEDGRALEKSAPREGRSAAGGDRGVSEGFEDQASSMVVDDGPELREHAIAEDALEPGEGARGGQAVGVKEGRRHGTE